MLKHLRIQNFAIIDEVGIDFGAGLNIISGETGAGKSILMDALALILGGRASSDLIRSGETEATVEALFEISENSEVHQVLESLGFSAPEGELIIRRIVHRSGKNRVFVNGNMANTTVLHSITESLVDLCSQHDQQLLNKPEEQLLWLDQYGGLEEERVQIRALFLEWREKRQALEALHTDSAQRAQRLDFLRFQINELEEAAILSATEDQEIEQELKVLGNAEHLFAFAADAEHAVFGTDTRESPSLLDNVGALLTRAKNLAASDPKLLLAVEHLSSLKLHTDELGYFLRSYGQGLARDEGRLEALNSRHDLLSKLKRKYGPTLENAISNLEVFQKELSLLENHESSLADAQEAAENSLARLVQAGEKLSAVRGKKTREFSQAVVKELAELHMDRSRFEAVIHRLEEPTATGFDSMRFEIAANPGEPMSPLHKVASGGELSRIVLALHSVVSSRGNVGVFLFDEVDSGIGGATAVSVGAKLRKVAHHNQVICITHLPQVAAFGQTHFRVDKRVEGTKKDARTICRVVALSDPERELEIARMLSGLGNDKTALANARAMLEMAESKGAGSKKAAQTKPPLRQIKSESTRKRS